jgi:hypothetical protein
MTTALDISTAPWNSRNLIANRAAAVIVRRRRNLVSGRRAKKHSV